MVGSGLVQLLVGVQFQVGFGLWCFTVVHGSCWVLGFEICGSMGIEIFCCWANAKRVW